MRAAQALTESGIPFGYVNVLQDAEVFENLPRYADWPTFPQVYIDGELVGGCDITLELAESGELKLTDGSGCGQGQGQRRRRDDGLTPRSPNAARDHACSLSIVQRLTTRQNSSAVWSAS